MKKLLLSIAILIAGQASYGRSIVPVLLEKKVSPIERFQPASGERTYVQVYPWGVVKGFTCTERRCDEGVEIAKLDRFQLQRINWLIKRAQKGAIVGPDPYAMRCLAIPTTNIRYTANSGTLLLEAAAVPCGGSSINDTRASLDLVTMLNRFHQQYNEMK